MKRFFVLFLFLLLPTALFARDFFQPINMAEVFRIMKKNGVTLLDVNVQEVWEKHHIPGAVHIDSPDIAKFLPADKKATLIFYCAGPLCEASGIAANESVMLGYRHVYVMTEGIFGWVKIGFPVESAASAKKRGAEKR
jgi:rhodanese-related sulfurtransferase